MDQTNPSHRRALTAARSLQFAALLLAVATAFTLRIVAHDRILLPDDVRFQNVDAWYHARLIEHQFVNYPHRMAFDPYSRWDAGRGSLPPPAFDFIGASLARMTGQTRATLPGFIALLPAILGAAVIIPTYLLGRRLGGPAVALLGAWFLAVMPGQFFVRSRLGNSDHHVLETLLLVLVVLGLAGLVRPAPRGRLAAAVATGAALGAYLLTFSGGVVLIAIVAIASAGTLVSARGADFFFRDIMGTLGVAAVSIWAWQETYYLGRIQFTALVATMAGLTLLQLARRHLAGDTSGLGLPAGVAAALAATAAILIAAVPVLRSQATALLSLSRFIHSDRAASIAEVGPWFGSFAEVLPVGLEELGPFFLLLPIAIAHAVRRVIRQGNAADISWAVVLVSLTLLALAQRRYVYYLAPMAAVGAAWCVWSGARRAGSLSRYPASGLAAAAATALLGFSLVVTWPQATYDAGPAEEWIAATDWLRESTPEPYATGSFLAPVNTAEDMELRVAEPYSVMAWWDRGYLIAARAQRIPIANPTQAGAAQAATFLLAEDPAAALDILRRYRSRYVVVDRTLAAYAPAHGTNLLGRYAALAAFAEVDLQNYVLPTLERDRSGTLRPRALYLPAYYRTMVTRLLINGGRAYRPTGSATVATLGRRPDGSAEVVARRNFADYAEAARYLDQVGGDHDVLVGTDPLASPVPLEAVPWVSGGRVFGAGSATEVRIIDADLEE